MHTVIAIDEPPGVGEGTVARAAAAALGFRHVDTGAMYRAVAWRARQLGVHEDDEEAMQRRDENDRTRQASPLSIAADATVIETTGMLVPEVISAVLAAVREREAGPSGAAGSLTANTNRRSVLRDR